MHNREIRSRSLMNCPPQDTGVALLQSGNDKQILYQHHIHIQKFKIKNRTRAFQFSRQLSFCLLYHHQAGSHEAGRVLFTREALFSQSLGNLGGCLGSRGAPTRVFGDAEEQMLCGESLSRRHRLITQFSPPPNVRKPE